jgi:hypothetical protein
MDAAYSSEILIKFHQITWGHIQKDSNFRDLHYAYSISKLLSRIPG